MKLFILTQRARLCLALSVFLIAVPGFAQAQEKPAPAEAGKTATESKPEAPAKAAAKGDAKGALKNQSAEAPAAEDGSDLEPPLEEMPHFWRAGVIATTNIYQDRQLPKGLESGQYRPYLNYRYRDTLSVLARGNMSVRHFNEQPASGQQTQVVGILEVASLETKIKKHTITVGRSFYQTEQGFLFANLADGLSYNGNFRFGTVKAWGLYSADYGQSLCSLNITGCGGDLNPFSTTLGLAADSGVTNSGRRIFAAAQYDSPAFNRTRFNVQGTAYGLYSKDLISEPVANTTRYSYNPYYAGAGAQGFVWSTDIQYRIDGIYQGGTVYNVGNGSTAVESKIQAFAALAKVDYILPFMKSIDTQLNFNFGMGSGDADATKVTTASQSNTADNYTAFQTFGSFSGGLALKPRLTNLQVYRAGVQMRPFKHWYALRNVGLQLKGSLYRKMNSAGGTSDVNASEDNADVGIAGDAALVYSVRNDIQFFYGFGVFKPGQAYPDYNSDGTDGRALRAAHIVSLTLVF